MNATVPTEGRADPYGLVGTVAGAYRVEALLDAGGAGLVYRAANVATKERVALKVLRSEGDRAALRARFAEEAPRLPAIAEGNRDIVAVLGSGELVAPRTGEPLPWLAYEWVDGTLLATHLAERRQRRMPGRSLGDTLDLVETAVHAVAHAHALGIVHRDLRPANLILARLRQGTHLKVLDYGVAAMIGGPPPDRAAPEQRSPDAGLVGPWTDIRALALVLLDVMTNDAVTDPEATLGALDLPRTVVELFRRALAPDPHARPAHLGLFWSALREAARSVVSSPAALAPTAVDEQTADEVQRLRRQLGGGARPSEAPPADLAARPSTPSPFTGTMLMVGGSRGNAIRAIEPEEPGSTAPLAMPVAAEPAPPSPSLVSPNAMSIGVALPLASPLAASIGVAMHSSVAAVPPAASPKVPTPQPFAPARLPSAGPPPSLAPPALPSRPAAARPSGPGFALGVAVGALGMCLVLVTIYWLFLRP